jgi:signal transduction histidine kinase
VLEVQDFGRGLPQAVIDRFERTGAGSGVGLAGIRERINELGGDFIISSTSSGTTLQSTVPLPTEKGNTHSGHLSEGNHAASPEGKMNNIVAGNRAS